MKNIAVVLIVFIISARGLAVTYDAKTNGALSRSSIAFLNGVQYSANAARTQSLPVASIPVITEYRAEDAGSDGRVQIAPFCISGGIMYGCMATAAANTLSGIYKSTDGVAWNVVGASASVPAIRIYPVNNSVLGNNGRILAVITDGSNARKLQYVNAGSTTLHDAMIGGSAFTFSSTPGNLSNATWWSYYQAPTGVMMINEYGNIDKDIASKVYKSTDDGATWTVVYNYTEHVSANTAIHSHAIAYHSATSSWVNVFGDNSSTASNGYVIKSTDNGNTWTDFKPQGVNWFQPVAFLDVGDATRLLCGDDSNIGLCWLDVTTFATEPLIDDAYTLNNGYCFNLFKHGSLWFADRSANGPGTDGQSGRPAPSTRRAGIYVSADSGATWSPYYNFKDSEVGITRFVGVLGNKLHFMVEKADTSFQHYSITLPVVESVSGICIDPATTNAIASLDGTTFTTGHTYFDPGAVGIDSLDTSEYLHGTASVKWVTQANNTKQFIWSNGSPNTDAWYSGRFAVKAASVDTTSAMGIKSNVIAQVPVYLGLSRTRWVTLVSDPWNPVAGGLTLGAYDNYLKCNVVDVSGQIRIPSGITSTNWIGAADATNNTLLLARANISWGVNAYVGLTLYNITTGQSGVITANTATTMTASMSGSQPFWHSDDVYKIAGGIQYYDCGQVELGKCSRWQVGGTARTHEKLTATHAYPAMWTQTVIFAPESNSDKQCAGFGNQYIFSAYKDSSNYISVYYNPSDHKFYMETVNAGGSATATGTSRAYNYFMNQPIRVTIRFNGSRLLFSVACGDSYEHVAPATSYAWCTAIAGTKTGNMADNNVLSMTLLESTIYDSVLSTATLDGITETSSATQSKRGRR